ncbi:hypothetical protein ACJJTC_017134 [Scirpophaga incertulas]
MFTCAGTSENKWDSHILDIQLGLNNTINKGIGKSPAQAFFGLNLVGFTEGKVKSYLDNECTKSRETIESIRAKINEYISDYQEKQKAFYDNHASAPKKIKKGDLVSIEREVPCTGQSRKLVPKFKGPYRVSSVLSNNRYKVEDTPLTRKGNRKYAAVIAVDKMKPWLHYQRSTLETSSDSETEAE